MEATSERSGDGGRELDIDPRRRRALAIVDDRERLSIDDFTSALCEREGVEEDAARERLRTELYHVVLPELADEGAVSVDYDARTVERSDEFPFDEVLTDRGTDERPPALRCERRRTVLTVLDDLGGDLSRTDLALHVAAAEREVALVDVAEDTHESVETALHHVELPKLADFGAVEYDAETGTVRLADDLPDPAASLLGREDGSVQLSADDLDHYEVRTIEGREEIVARGQSLFERADDELFLMFTTDGLLDPGCVERLEDAVDRGVDVYVGSQTQAVRDLVRERVPEAVIWEPQLDWLNLPPQRDRLGRLVMADREAVMLGTLGPERDDGVYRETAVTGEGADNSLVLLLREMLGSRLDHLDAQSEDVLSHIPL